MAKEREKKSFKKDSTVIPSEVVDKDSYLSYIAICSDRLLNEERIWITSDDIEIDLCAGLVFIRRLMAHLTDEEKQSIEDEAGKRRKLIGQMNSFKRKAFGLKNSGGKIVVHEHLLDTKKAELIELFGQFHSLQEVHKIVVQDWGYDIGIQSLQTFRDKCLELILEKQEVFKRDYSDLRLGYKRSRLDELHYLYHDRKATYEKTKSREDYKLLLMTIEQIKKEVEVDTIRIDGNIDVTVEQNITMKINQELMKTLSLIDIVLGRIAGRLGMNPQYLAAKLHQSFYAKFSGLGTETDYEDEIIYPSEQTYDFDKIKKVQAKEKDEKPKLLLSKPLPPLEIEEGDSVKKRLKDLIKKKQAEIAISKATITNLPKPIEVTEVKKKPNKKK